MADTPRRPLIASLVDQFTDEFGEIAAQIVPEIRTNLDLGMSPRVAVISALEKFHVNQRITDSILNKLVAASAIGFGVAPVNVVDAVGIRRTFLNATWPGDSLTLSQRIARADYRQIIIDTMDAQMRRSGNWNALAGSLTDKKLIAGTLPDYIDRLTTAARKDFVDQPELKAEFIDAMKAARKRVDRLSLNGAPNQSVKAAYNEILHAAQTLDDKALDKALHQAVTEKGRYNAERIARTEMARAYGAGVDLHQAKDTDVIAERIMLSTRHPHYDICNFHTQANLYGMGPGVYPKTHKPPYPFHPHCLCLKVDVFEGEVELNTKMDPAAAQKFIESLSVEKQKDLLGVAGQEAFAKNPKSWQKHLKNWEGIQPVKLVEGLTPEMFEHPKQAASLLPAAHLPQTLEEKVAAMETRLRPQRFESAAVFAPDGRELLFKNGQERFVEFTDPEVALMRGAVVTHNHPGGWKFAEDDPRRGGNAFSIDDVKLAAGAEAREMRAASPGYDHSIAPGPKGWNLDYYKSDILPAFRKHEKDVYSQGETDILAGRKTIAQFNADYYHTIWTRVADELGLRYSRKSIKP
jgi:hypothetical protein